MKIIFLDIDGVLNHPPFQVKTVDRVLCERMHNVLKATGAKIVVSSSWRHGMTLRQISKKLCIPLSHFVGKTPTLNDPVGNGALVRGATRGDEIQKWFNDFVVNAAKAGWPVGITIDPFVIVDDNADMEPYMAHLVQTDHAVGLTEANAEEIIRRLCG